MKSAGILLYRFSNKTIEFFLVHPGGPFWKNKDEGAWSIPKGEFSDNEDPLSAAIREFREETGHECEGTFLPLSPAKLKSGKIIFAWALNMDIDEKNITSNEFDLEWPPRSGKYIRIPEIDKGGWFDETVAVKKINPAQANLIRELVVSLKG